jgi:hypothetical protein
MNATCLFCCSFEFEHLPEVWWHTETPDDALAIHEEPEGEQQHRSEVKDCSAVV